MYKTGSGIASVPAYVHNITFVLLHNRPKLSFANTVGQKHRLQGDKHVNLTNR